MASDKTTKEPTELGRRILERLTETGLSQNKFEEAAGLGRGYSSRLIYGDRGQRMDGAMIVRIARVLEVSTDWLLTGIGPREHSDPYQNRASVVRVSRGRIADDVLQQLYGQRYDNCGHHTREWWLAEVQRLTKEFLERAIREDKAVFRAARDAHMDRKAAEREAADRASAEAKRPKKRAKTA